MRLACPVCGDRDSREFICKGHAAYLERPAADAGIEAWDDYLHNRENPAGPTREVWYHAIGCGAWLVVARDTITHEITSLELAREARR